MGYLLSDWGRTKISNAATELKIVAGISGLMIGAATFFLGTEAWRGVMWSPLERAYWGAYEKSWAPLAASVDGKGGMSEYVIYCKRKREGAAAGRKKSDPLKDGSITAVTNEEAKWGANGLELREEVAAEWEAFPMKVKRENQAAHEWLRINVYEEKTLLAKFAEPWWWAGGLWILVIGGAGAWSARERARAKARKVLRGTETLTAKEFERKIRGDGLGIPHMEKKRVEYLRIRSADETEHVQVIGDTRQGKSVLLHWFLHQVGERRLHRVACYDAALEFWERHGRGERGDVLLHPLSEGCPFWDVADEIESAADATQLAKSFLPNRDEARTEFWDQAPQRLLAFLLLRMKERNLGIGELLRWMANADEIDELVEGTDLAPLIADNAAAQRAGVFASMNAIADALKLLPPDDGGAKFSFRKWAESGRGWIFIGSRPNERDALKPLISAWLDTLFGKLMREAGSQKATWCFVDELPTLQRLPKLKGALQEAGKYNLRFVEGFQGRAQLEHLYGKEAETLMSAPGTRIFLKTKEYSAAKWIAENIGLAEQTREAESLTASVGQGRDSVNYHEERRTDYVILPNEIQNLEKLSGYLRYDRYVTAIKFAPLDLEIRNQFRERRMGRNESVSGAKEMAREPESAANAVNAAVNIKESPGGPEKSAAPKASAVNAAVNEKEALVKESEAKKESAARPAMSETGASEGTEIEGDV